MERVPRVADQAVPLALNAGYRQSTWAEAAAIGPHRVDTGGGSRCTSTTNYQ